MKTLQILTLTILLSTSYVMPQNITTQIQDLIKRSNQKEEDIVYISNEINEIADKQDQLTNRAWEEFLALDQDSNWFNNWFGNFYNTDIRKKRSAVDHSTLHAYAERLKHLEKHLKHNKYEHKKINNDLQKALSLLELYEQDVTRAANDAGF